MLLLYSRTGPFAIDLKPQASRVFVSQAQPTDQPPPKLRTNGTKQKRNQTHSAVRWPLGIVCVFTFWMVILFVCRDCCSCHFSVFLSVREQGLQPRPKSSGVTWGTQSNHASPPMMSKIWFLQVHYSERLHSRMLTSCGDLKVNIIDRVYTR